MEDEFSKVFEAMLRRRGCFKLYLICNDRGEFLCNYVC